MKRIFFLVIFAVFAFGITASAQEVKVPFLLYHSVADFIADGDDELLHITKDNFADHMAALKAAGYTSITIDEFVMFAEGELELPEKPLVICFDDGYENNYTNAYPILKENGMKATIFVIAQRVGDHTVKYPHFTWQQAKEMEDSGVIEIESHSLTHPDFSTIGYAETVRQMRLSKYLIEKNLGKTCDYMAYPYGFTNAFSADVAKKAGYKLTCLVGNDGANGKGADLYSIKRLNVSAYMTSEYLMEYISENITR